MIVGKSQMASIAVSDEESIRYLPHGWPEMLTKDGELQTVLAKAQ